MTYSGTIKTVIHDKGFGFIQMAGGPDVFFHFSDLAPGLDFDEHLVELPVEFELIQTDRGPRAANVRTVE